VFVKPPEVLTRDRLLGTYEVKPVLAKLRRTLLGAGGMLLVVSVLLFGLIKAGTDEDGVYGELFVMVGDVGGCGITDGNVNSLMHNTRKGRFLPCKKVLVCFSSNRLFAGKNGCVDTGHRTLVQIDSTCP
jgi:hypothetical protein